MGEDWSRKAFRGRHGKAEPEGEWGEIRVGVANTAATQGFGHGELGGFGAPGRLEPVPGGLDTGH